MKKGKLLTSLLLASALGLAGCDLPKGGDNHNYDDDKPVVVTDSVVKVIINGSQAQLEAGQTLKLSASVEVTGNPSRAVTWSSSDTSKATVDSTGLVTAKSAGTVKIKATSNADSTKFAEVSIEITEAAKAWSSEVQDLMKQYLDGVVLGYVEGTWEWDYYSEYDSVIGMSEDGKISDALAIFADWDNLGPDSYGDDTFKLTTDNGEVYAQAYSVSGGLVIQAYFVAPTVLDEDWSDASKEAMNSFLGFEIPFIPAAWEDLELDEDTLYAAGEAVDIEAAETALTEAGYSFVEVEAMLWYEYHATLVSDAGLVTVILEDWSDWGFGWALEITLTAPSTEWPAEDIADFVGTYMDFEAEVVPMPAGSEKFFVEESEDYYTITCVGADGAAYLEALSGEGWEVSDETLEDFGCYQVVSPNGTACVYVYVQDGSTKLEITPSIPKLEAWPSEYVASFVSEQLLSEGQVPAVEGGSEYYYLESEAYLSDESDETAPIAQVTIFFDEDISTKVSEYKSALEELGFTTSYTPLSDEYYEAVIAKNEEKGLSVQALRIDDDETDGVYEMIVQIAPFISSSEEGSGATFDFKEITSTSGEQNGFSFAAAKGEGQSNPAYNDTDKELRLYDKNTLTISGESEITSIDLNDCGRSHNNNGAKVTADCGTLTETDDGYHWEGNATTVVFTVEKIDSSHKQCHLSSIVINGGGSSTPVVDIDVEAAFEEMKAIMNPIASAIYGISESDVTYGDMEGANDGVVSYYKDSSLVFLSIFDSLGTTEPGDMVETLKGKLPADAVYNEEMSEEYADEGYFDTWYEYGDYYIGIYAYNAYFSVDIVPIVCYDAYYAYYYS